MDRAAEVRQRRPLWGEDQQFGALADAGRLHRGMAELAPPRKEEAVKVFRSMTAIKPYRKFIRRIPYGAFLTGVSSNGGLNYYITDENVFGWMLK